MASFNLGRIRGEKGDRGEMGPKGDTGAKGEKGDKGDNGRDGVTPVFRMGNVKTLKSGKSAYAEIDNTNPAAPVLYLEIPAGRDGKDANADMLKSVYDENGECTDIFKYAQNLFSTCLKYEGGTLSGNLVAAESPLSEKAVRNVSISTKLPSSGAEGEIFILLTEKVSKTLGECREGDQVVIKEGGNDTAYIVVGINYHKSNSVTLLRKDMHYAKCCYDKRFRGEYKMSDIDVFLESMFASLYPQNVRDSLISVERDTDAYRRCFLLSKGEYTDMAYFSDTTNRAANKDGTTTKGIHITATIGASKTTIAVTTNGEFVSVSSATEENFRPAIILPSTFPVVNTQIDSQAAVVPVSAQAGIYVFADGEWKECALR